MKIPFTGGCVCRAIRYECSAEPIMMFKCHCRDCQQVTGGGFVAGQLRYQLSVHFTRPVANRRVLERTSASIQRRLVEIRDKRQMSSH